MKKVHTFNLYIFGILLLLLLLFICLQINALTEGIEGVEDKLASIFNSLNR
ncbi:hypothetical protein ACQKL5_16225 [Peribacillus sp. NPDC097675]|uniref:hypothetical protein n=1 Tax=Peribacillus sp. NPDC097675 TaxID=3390618 RepID=UPI003CFC5A09